MSFRSPTQVVEECGSDGSGSDEAAGATQAGRRAQGVSRDVAQLLVSRLPGVCLACPDRQPLLPSEQGPEVDSNSTKDHQERAEGAAPSAEARLWWMAAATEQVPRFRGGNEAAVPATREATNGSAPPSAGSSPHPSSQPLTADTARTGHLHGSHQATVHSQPRSKPSHGPHPADTVHPQPQPLLLYSLLGLCNSSRKAPIKAIVRPPYMRAYRCVG